ncbi:ABC transporter ATP-binding protein, partial [Pseudomonas syringae pv. actinidiae ICMP 19096]
FADIRLPLPESLQHKLANTSWKSLKVGIRPEFVHVWDGPYDDAMCADVTYVEDLGTYKIITLKLAGQLLKVRLQEDKPVPQGQAWISFPGQWLMLYADDYLLEAGPASEVPHA